MAKRVTLICDRCTAPIDGLSLSVKVPSLEDEHTPFKIGGHEEKADRTLTVKDEDWCNKCVSDFLEWREKQRA